VPGGGEGKHGKEQGKKLLEGERDPQFQNRRLTSQTGKKKCVRNIGQGRGGGENRESGNGLW